MKPITLTQGQVALVDDSDFDWLSQWNWNALRGRDGKFYAVRTSQKPESKTRKTIYMHRVITGIKSKSEIDHKDGNGLNNRRNNLREATPSQNRRNRGRQANNTSGFKGVTWHKLKNKWQAQIRKDEKTIYLGTYLDCAEAARKYDSAAKVFYGQFAKLNF